MTATDTLPLREWPAAALTVARTFGWRGARLRVSHEFRKRVNAFRAEPHHRVSPHGGPLECFRVDAARLRAATDHTEVISRALRVCQGEYEAYRSVWCALPDSPAAWNAGRDGASWWPELPWWRVPHYRAGADIKDVWEPARFGWLYDLVRAYLVSGEARFAEAAAKRAAGFVTACPPFRGPQWGCGQETAIRAIALLYAEAAFADAQEWAPVAPVVERLLAASGERIADAIGYAVSQRNNHAISEAVGLLVLGHRFADLHPEAASWRASGAAWLATLVEEQFAPDGWYIQHSFTYLRLAADQCVVAARVAPLPRRVRDRLAAALRLLLAVMDPATGLVPNHGNNDGAFVHPITTASYRDFRGIVTALAAVTGEALPANVTPDAEVLAWLGLERPATVAPIGDGVVQGASGWVTLRLGHIFVFLRAGDYRSRPGHVDALHLEVRSAGREVIVDPGTYRYRTDESMPIGLDSENMHNGPTIPSRPLALRGPRFLWYRWPSARIRSAGPEPEAEIVAESRVGVRRTVRVEAGTVLVTDEAPVQAGARVRWLLAPRLDAAVLATSGAGVRRVFPGGAPSGWFSPHYGQRMPATAVVLDVPPGGILVTIISPSTADISA